MIKKVIVIALVIGFFIGPLNYASAAPIFSDVTDTFTSKAEFDFLVKEGILAADPTLQYGVNDDVTRIQAVEILGKALKLNLENRPIPTFVDVAPDDPLMPLIAAIVDEKIMTGNGKGEFMANEKLTRAQMALILVRAYKLEGTTDFTFKDVPKTYMAHTAIQALIANEITNGYLDNTFKPGAFITKTHYLVFIARILNPEFRKKFEVPKPVPVACEKPVKTKTYKVNVQVTSLWHEPNKTRAVDKPSLSNPVNISKWTKDMTLSQKWWLVDKIDTQALYGDEVTILKSSGNWHRIAIKDQYVPYQKQGYPGWVPKSHVVATSTDFTDCSIAIVKAKMATLYNVENKKKYMDISYSTILPVIKVEGEWLHVQTPVNGVKLMKKNDVKTVKKYADIPKPSQQQIVNEAKRFLNLPYLWAGTSALGFDCSGIIYAVYKNHGILIPRDSFYQATKGKVVSKSNLQPGDLVFFAGNSGKGKVYHVGLYVGDGKMIHAPNASSKVKIESINAGAYKRNYSGARRYID